MHPLTTSVLVTILCTYLVAAELEPHRTVLNLSRFNYTIEKPVLDPSKPNVTLGFLTSFKDIEKLLIAGAVPLAVDMVNEDPELLPYHNLRFIAYDSGEADSALPLKKMTQMREEGVIGFIGLDGSCEHEALLAAAWDMAMVSYVFEEMLSLEERIVIVSWKLGDKTYEEVRQLYHRKYGKQPPTRANIRLSVNKFRRIGSVADEKRPGRPSTSVRLNLFTSSLILALVGGCFPYFRWYS